ncbi:PAS domain S-box protein [bacterium]|nr:PAS domain S-box protein [bacterium]
MPAKKQQTELNISQDSDQSQNTFFHHLLESADEYFLKINFDSTSAGPSSAFLVHLGYSATLSKTHFSLFEWVHPNDLRYLKDVFAELKERQPVKNIRFRLKAHNEEWHLFSCRMLRSTKVIYLILQDITHRRVERLQLMEQLAFYEKIIEKSRDTVMRVLLPELTIDYVSPAINRFTGFSAEEITGQKLLDFLAIVVESTDFNEVSGFFEKKINDINVGSRAAGAHNFRISHRHGRHIWVNCEIKPGLESYRSGSSLQLRFQDISQEKQLEEVLDESQEDYRGIVENTHNLFAVLDTNGYFQFASGQWQQFIPFFAEDLHHHALNRFVHPDDQQTVTNILLELAAEEKHVHELKFRIVGDAGQLFWQLASFTSKADATGHVRKIYLVAEDITDLVRIEDELKQRLEYERTLAAISKNALVEPDFSLFLANTLSRVGQALNGCRVIYCVHDANLTQFSIVEEWASAPCQPLESNPFFYQQLPEFKEQLLASEILSGLPADTLFNDKNQISDSGRLSGSMNVIPVWADNFCHGFLVVQDPDPAREWRRHDLDFLRMAVHNVSYRLEMNLEQQRRLQVEEQLQQSEERYRLIVNQAPVGIIRFNNDWQVTDINDFGLKICGLDSFEMLVDQLNEYRLFSKEDANELRLMLRNNRKVTSYQLELNLSDKSTAMLLVNGEYDEYETEIPYIFVFQDDTERFSLQEQLLHAQKQESIGTLAGGMAHDFNNLLSGIMGYASLILKEIDSQTNPFYWDIKHILQISERGAELTKKLLALGRPHGYAPAPCQVNEIVDEVTSILTRTIDKAISVITQPAADLKMILADSGQIQQALLNICLNARDAIDGVGEIEIKTSNTFFDEQFVTQHVGVKAGPHVCISIADTGAGMDEFTKSKIFEPFFTTKAQTGGTGLGLAMVYGIVKTHEGLIEVDSQPGKGSAFLIYLPVTEGVVPVAKEETTEQIFKGNELILVVDDEEIIRNIAKRILERAGYKVMTAGDGHDAAKLYQQYMDDIKLVILDLMMPHIDGVHTAALLKEVDTNVRILISSGYAKEEQLEKLRDMGISEIIQKPYQYNELLIQVRQTLDSGN